MDISLCNTLRPSDAYMYQQTNHYWFRQGFVACPAPSHYLNQYWNIIEPLGTNFVEILIEIHTFSLEKMDLKMSFGNGSHFVSTSRCFYWRYWMNSKFTSHFVAKMTLVLWMISCFMWARENIFSLKNKSHMITVFCFWYHFMVRKHRQLVSLFNSLYRLTSNILLHY